MKLLEVLAKLCAVFAGLVMLIVALATCGSIFSRAVFGASLLGDFELVQVGMAFAVASFMPLCQLRHGHIIVDFFTTRASHRTRHGLDRTGCLLVGLMAGLLAWRTLLGGISARESQSVTMLLQFPEWIAFMAMVPPLALTAVIGIVQSLRPMSNTEESSIVVPDSLSQ
ncbi:MAG: TRAP transporter small permease [Burkholderiales bacterium]|nr:TRAP transporter small permease [Burkholderiales bacterium]